MKISLAMIAGNEEAVIARCLDSFKPIYDEAIVCLAVGSQKPDGTQVIALERGATVCHYQNAPGNDWPHVDDFAAARNTAFDAATGDVVIWCDADDILDPGMAEQIRKGIEEAKDWDILACRYDVRNVGLKNVIRERAFRRQDDGRLPGRWEGAIHEHFIPSPNMRIVGRDDLVWVHAPELKKVQGHERNKNILTAALKTAPSYLYYLQQEYHQRDAAKALPLAKAAWEIPGLPDVEKYECAMNIAINTAGEERMGWIWKAIRLMPYRREAFALAVASLIDEGKNDQAFGLCRIMHGIEPPNPRPWTHQARWYEDGGVLLFSQCCRLTGRDADAIRNEDEMFAKAGKQISLCHATRGRAKKALQTATTWRQRAAFGPGVQHIFAIDADDKESLELLKGYRHVVVAPGSCVRAWNAAAAASEGSVLVQMSDDWLPPVGWDRLILDAIGDVSKPAVLAVGDGHRTDDLLCMAIMTRARWEQQGREMFSPEYASVFSDNEFSYRAWSDGVVIDARKSLVFEHDHPVFKGVDWQDMDATYRHSNADDRYRAGMETFARRNPDAVRTTAHK
jgi:hypothetical protein